MSTELRQTFKLRCEQLAKYFEDHPDIFNEDIDEKSLFVSVNFKKKSSPSNEGKLAAKSINSDPIEVHCCGIRGCGPFNCP